jgi:hypothetical protein
MTLLMKAVLEPLYQTGMIVAFVLDDFESKTAPVDSAIDFHERPDLSALDTIDRQYLLVANWTLSSIPLYFFMNIALNFMNVKNEPSSYIYITENVSISS